MLFYPQLRDQLKPAIDEYIARNGYDSDNGLKAIAGELGVSVAALSSWRNGQRRPPDRAVRQLARILKNGVGEEEFVTILLDAREQKLKAWAERVQTGETTLLMQQTVYAGAGQFWSLIFERILDWSRIRYELVGPKEKRDFLQLREMLWAPGNLDVALGILATPEMLVKLHFLEAPVRYRVNAVFFNDTASVLGPLSDLQENLAPNPEDAIRARQRLKEFHRLVTIVAMRGEIGQCYVEQLMAESIPVERLVARLEPRRYIDAMLKSAPALAVADEITCLEIVAEARRVGRRASLLYGLRTGPPGDLREPGALLPDFSLGVGVTRNLRGGVHAKELIEFLEESLALFLQSNSFWVAACYLDLLEQVRAVAEEALPETPRATIERWLSYTFRLQPNLLTAYGIPRHWKEVLTAAAALR